jgi:hypothetical protein
MTKSKIVIAISLVAALAIGWQLNEAVSAKSTPQKVCLTAFGTLSKRTSCLAGETELASGKVRNAPIKKREMPKGKTRLGSRASSGISTSADSPGVPLVSTLGSSVRSYTYVMGFPANWTGTITTTCSETEVALDVYATYFIDGERVPVANGLVDRWQVASGGAWLQFDNENLDIPSKRIDLFFDVDWATRSHTGRITAGPSFFQESGNDIIPIPSGLSLYVTQLCAPLTTLENAG